MQSTERLEQRIEALKVYRDELRKCFSEVRKIPKASNPSSILDPQISFLRGLSSPVGFKSVTESCLNELLSFVDGVRSGVRSSSLRPTHFRKVLGLLDERIAQSTRRLAMMKEDASDVSLSDELQSRVSSEFDRVRRAAQCRSVSCFASVIPIFQTPMNTSMLHGFSVSNFSGYTVFHHQLCVSVNCTKVDSVDDFLAERIAYLSKKHGKKYVLLTDKGVVSDLTGFHVRWFWLMDEPKLDALRGAFSYEFFVKDWGFSNAH